MSKQTYWIVTADHVHADYRFKGERVKVTEQADGFFAEHSRLGCGKTYPSAEEAVRHLFLDHGCTRIRCDKVRPADESARTKPDFDKLDNFYTTVENYREGLLTKNEACSQLIVMLDRMEESDFNDVMACIAEWLPVIRLGEEEEKRCAKVEGKA